MRIKKYFNDSLEYENNLAKKQLIEFIEYEQQNDKIKDFGEREIAEIKLREL